MEVVWCSVTDLITLHSHFHSPGSVRTLFLSQQFLFSSEVKQWSWWDVLLVQENVTLSSLISLKASVTPDGPTSIYDWTPFSLEQKDAGEGTAEENHSATKPQQWAGLKEIKNMLQDFRSSLRIHQKLKNRHELLLLYRTGLFISNPELIHGVSHLLHITFNNM